MNTFSYLTLLSFISFRNPLYKETFHNHAIFTSHFWALKQLTESLRRPLPNGIPITTERLQTELSMLFMLDFMEVLTYHFLA
jgi:hypothetical protein